MPPHRLIALLLLPALAACQASPAPVKSGGNGPALGRPPAKTVVRTPGQRPAAPPRVQTLRGIDGVIGATAAELTRLFGPARLDVGEGDARKLQFSGAACVLDIYLYPAAAGREPQAAFVDARRASDGLDVDRAACIAALRRP